MPNSASNIRVFDLQRMFLGDLPWLFTCEVIVRTILVYVYTLLLIRLLSKRAVGQLSLIEFLLVIALGSAVGDPMFYHDVPLLHGMAVITVVVLLNRGLVYGISHYESIERFLEGDPCAVIREGLMLQAGLKTARLSREELFESLRLQGIKHLGEVRAAYIEQGGHLSVFCYPPHTERLGIRAIPPWDLDPPGQFCRDQQIEHDILLGCVACGSVRCFIAGQKLPACDYCKAQTWVDAVYTPSSLL